MEPGYSANEMDRPVPVAIFVVNFDKVQGLAFNTIFLSPHYIGHFLFVLG
jgi:hypothetical protein